MKICESLFIPLQFAIPSCMFSQALPSDPVLLAQIDNPDFSLPANARSPSRLALFIDWWCFLVDQNLNWILINHQSINKARREGERALAGRLKSGLSIWAKRTGSDGKACENMHEGIANCNGINRDSQIFNYDI